MSVIAVERALVLLRLMAGSRDGVSVRAVARELGYSPAMTQKLLQALVSQGFSAQDPSTQLYHLGPIALQVGLVGLARLEVRRLARPHLEALVTATEETALLGVRQRDSAVYIDQVASPHEVRMNVPLGDLRPYNCTAVGKALLAFAPEEELDRLASTGAFVKPTEHSVDDPARLRSMISDIRARGFALDDEEFRLGTSCVAAPIRSHNGDVNAAFVVAGPTYRMAPRRDAIIAAVLRAAELASSELGYMAESTPDRIPA